MQRTLNIIVTDSDFADVALETEVVTSIGAVLERQACKTSDDVIATSQHADALMVQWAQITRRVMENLPQLKAIVRFGIGVDMLDVKAATEMGIAVCNTPDYCIEEVAEHALSLMLTFARGLNVLPGAIRSKRWGVKAIESPIRTLSNQTLGLVGLGRIGRRVAQLGQSLGMTVIAYDPYARPDHVPHVSFDELLARSDFISLHSPLTDETRNMFDPSAFAKMKPSAYLINTSRGGLIDMAALCDALETGRIAGAGLDVLPKEPPDWTEPILSAPNLVLTPHVAWYSVGAPERMRREAAQTLVKLFRGERPSGLLNPEVLRSGRWTNVG